MSHDNSKKKEIAKKMKVKHSDDKIGFYRSFKDKEDYTKGHIKAHTIRPKKGLNKKIYEYVNDRKITPKMESRAKKAGFYKHGDPRFGDVYEK